MKLWNKIWRAFLCLNNIHPKDAVEIHTPFPYTRVSPRNYQRERLFNVHCTACQRKCVEWIEVPTYSTAGEQHEAIEI